jgi:hypothetical protein
MELVSLSVSESKYDFHTIFVGIRDEIQKQYKYVAYCHV